MARGVPPTGPADDPVGDWGPDLGHGIFDTPERSSSEPSGEVTGHEVTATRVPGHTPAERPVAVLAWIGSTLAVAPGARRGEVPGLRAVVASEPLALLPGGFFPARGPTTPDRDPRAQARPAPVVEVREVPPPAASRRSPSAAAPPPARPAPPTAVEEAPVDPAPPYSRPPREDDAQAAPPASPGALPRRWEEAVLACLLVILVVLSLRAC